MLLGRTVGATTDGIATDEGATGGMTTDEGVFAGVGTGAEDGSTMEGGDWWLVVGAAANPVVPLPSRCACDGSMPCCSLQ